MVTTVESSLTVFEAKISSKTIPTESFVFSQTSSKSSISRDKTASGKGS
jgi:hypothetical protein